MKKREGKGHFREYLERVQKIFGSVSIDRCETKRASYFANRIFLLALEFENIFSLLILNNCITINESNMRCYTSLQRNYFMTFKYIKRTVYYYYREYKISSLLHAHDIKRY